MDEEKEARLTRANDYIRTVNGYAERIRSEEVKQALLEVSHSLGNLRDAQYLFDSGEKELIRLYERYMPYFIDILAQYETIENSGNYEALQKHRTALLKTLKEMNGVIKTVTTILPQDEIDEANARAKADELRRMLEEQRRSMVK